MVVNHHEIMVQGICTHYIEAGSGPSTVALLHGGGLDNAELSWGLVIPVLAANHRVIALDWPGFGKTGRAAGPVSIGYYVEFLSAFLDALNVERASLVGISMGGGVALGFTLQRPERVEKLVLVDSYGLQRAAPMHKLSYLMVRIPGLMPLSWAMMRSRPMLRASLKSLLLRPGAVTDDLVEQAYQQVTQPGTAEAWMSFQTSEMLWNGTRTCYLDRLGEITAPTLIVHGSKDELVPTASAREAHQRIRGSRLHWMEGCGHWPQRDHPEEFHRVVQEFLK